MLELKGLTKIYGSGKNAVVALKDVNLTFGDRGMVIILGKSGSGKSTLINLLGGLDKATYGEVVINGKSNRTFSASENDAYRNTYVGIVFQEFNLIEDITVFEKIDMTLKLQEGNGDINSVEEVLSSLGLSNLGYRKPGELSGGQRQRVSLARALIKNPEIILADEPTGALDSETSEEVFEALKNIAQQKLVIIVTHERDLAAKYGDRIIRLVDGQIVSDMVRPVEYTQKPQQLCAGLIDVPQGGAVTAEMLNANRAGSGVQYIGLSHDKERIALAYPDTVDAFYKRNDASAYRATEKSDIVNDNKRFELNRSTLSGRAAYQLARSNRKRTKKRTWLTTVFSAVSMAFVTVAIILSMIDISSLVAANAFDTYETEVLQLKRYEQINYGYLQKSLYEDDIDFIKSTGANAVAMDYSLSLYPAFLPKIDTGSDYLNGFYRLIEGALPEELGIKMLYGTSQLDTFTELVISDYAADTFVLYGYPGVDKKGSAAILKPDSAEEIIGTQFFEEGDYGGIGYTIKGVFQTNYKTLIQYRSRIDSDMQTAFEQNKDFIYSAVFAKTGFHEQIGQSVLEHVGYGDIFYGQSVRGSYNVSVYPENLLKAIGVPAEQIPLLWAKDGGYTDPVLPQSLAKNEIIIVETVDTEYLGRDVILSVYLSQTWQRVDNLKVEVAAVIDGQALSWYFKDHIFINRTLVYGEASGESYDSVVIPRGTGKAALRSMIQKWEEHDIYPSTASLNAYYLVFLKSTLQTIQTVFLWIALGCAAFAFLIILINTSLSIKFRLKEIGVYRIMGARGWDIGKIFFLENGFIVIWTAVLASLLAGLVTWITNAALKDLLRVYSLGSLKIAAFSFWHVGFIFLVSALFITLACIFPILSIIRKRPVDALKMI